jgi:protocatechuate 4,5-dioxygenase alpha chain
MTAAAAIPGTPIFTGAEAARGYAINRLCYSLNEAANRAAFLANEAGYCARYGLDAAQTEAIRRRNILAMIAAGGNVYYLSKLAGAFGMNVQDMGAQQTGVSVEAFKLKLLEQAH